MVCGGVPLQVEVQICGRFVVCHDCLELPDECFYAKVVGDRFVVSAEVSLCEGCGMESGPRCYDLLNCFCGVVQPDIYAV